jgi:hypothetical protein
MITKANVLDPVVNLVLGWLTINDFIKKFVPLSHNIHRNGTAEAIEAAGIVEGHLAVLYGTEQSESTFLVGLRELVNYSAGENCTLAYVVSDMGAYTRIQN